MVLLFCPAALMSGYLKGQPCRGSPFIQIMHLIVPPQRRGISPSSCVSCFPSTPLAFLGSDVNIYTCSLFFTQIHRLAHQRLTSNTKSLDLKGFLVFFISHITQLFNTSKLSLCFFPLLQFGIDSVKENKLLLAPDQLLTFSFVDLNGILFFVLCTV